ncbi:hypothetical protein [Crocinitomix catalasitica]|uniref:hypothetical protein n=1 Tax=Crocinitomix catalasitica TaxID=184607 RepID=UPI0004827B6C|nr:hypothetical protein [Crocinitomix catalasitica]
MKNIVLVYLFLVACKISFAQVDAVVIWCSTESSITYPIVITNDSITDEFTSEQIKYRNSAAIKKKRLYNIILNDTLQDDKLFTIFNIIQSSYNDLIPFEEKNEYLSFPEIRYIKNGELVEKLVIESKEKFKELMEGVKPNLKDEFNDSNYINFCNHLNAIYLDVADRYFEIKTEQDK